MQSQSGNSSKSATPSCGQCSRRRRPLDPGAVLRVSRRVKTRSTITSAHAGGRAPSRPAPAGARPHAPACARAASCIPSECHRGPRLGGVCPRVEIAEAALAAQDLPLAAFFDDLRICFQGLPPRNSDRLDSALFELSVNVKHAGPLSRSLVR